MRELADAEVTEVGLTSVALDGFCAAMLADLPGAGVVIFDHELRVRLAAGAAFAPTRGRPMVGRLLPDLMAAESWRILEKPYEAAVAGRATRLELAADGALFSIQVRPILLAGDVRGAFAVSHMVDERRRRGNPIGEREDAAAASEQVFRSAFEHAPIGITVIGPDGRWLKVNDACCQMLGYEREELLGTSFGSFTDPEDGSQDRQLLEAAAAAGGSDSLEREKRYLHKDGSDVWVHARLQMIRDQAGEPLYVVAHLQDISDRREAQDLLRESERMLRSVIDNTPSIICVKGRDHLYRLVNREFEEWCGLPADRILGRSAAEMPWRSLVEGGREKDQAVLDGAGTDQEEEAMWYDGKEHVFLTTRFPLLDEHGEINGVCSASRDITGRRQEERRKRARLQCSADINAALAQDRFVLHGQPIVNLVTMQVEQAELLVRMLEVHGGTGLIAPAEFLPAAERFDLIGLIDEWVVGQAVEHAAAGHRVEVNLSAKTISNPHTVDWIEQRVLASAGAPGNLVFEITETAVADNLDAARVFANRLRRLGCAFALDDFGVGHGTFTYLKHLPVDYLKIDLQFVRDLLSDESDRHVVQAIIGVAKQFEIRTIAEGVEDQATLEALRRMGVDYAQGYWIGRPVPVDQLWNPRTNGSHHSRPKSTTPIARVRSVARAREA